MLNCVISRSKQKHIKCKRKDVRSENLMSLDPYAKWKKKGIKIQIYAKWMNRMRSNRTHTSFVLDTEVNFVFISKWSNRYLFWHWQTHVCECIIKLNSNYGFNWSVDLCLCQIIWIFNKIHKQNKIDVHVERLTV